MKLFRILAVATVLTLAGCHGGGVTIGGLSFPVKKNFEIVDSSFDESFKMAYRAMEESNLEIYKSNSDSGEIEARSKSGSDVVTGDVRTFRKNSAELKFRLEKAEPGKLVFIIQSKSSGDGYKYIDQFIEKYNQYIEFKDAESGFVQNKPVITEIRSESKTLSEKLDEKEASDSGKKNYTFSVKGEPSSTEVRTDYGNKD